METVLFRDGTRGRFRVYRNMGAALAGSPTCYVYRNGKKVPVVAGESVRWVEVAPKPIDNVFYARESTSRFYSLLKENDK